MTFLKMKKIFSLILFSIIASSCSNDVKFNNPGFQAYRDGVLFRAIDVKAYKSVTTGAVSFIALAQDEEVNLNVANSYVGTYYLGTSNTNTQATYESTFNGISLSYQTSVITGPVAKMYPSMISGGTGYISDCTTLGTSITCTNSHATTGGTGSGLTLSVITNNSGIVTSVKVASPGTGYKSGDVITIVGGGNDAKIQVLNVVGSNGEVNITENTGDTITGNFKFNAINSNGNPLGGEQVNFQYGSFYKVPVIPTP